MSRTDEQRVADILEACDRITRLVDRGRSAFDHDDAVAPAIERLLEIIGEAATQLSGDRRAQSPDLPRSKIAGLRVRLAHHYHRTDPALVWQIASESIPELSAALRHTS